MGTPVTPRTHAIHASRLCFAGPRVFNPQRGGSHRTHGNARNPTNACYPCHHAFASLARGFSTRSRVARTERMGMPVTPRTHAIHASRVRFAGPRVFNPQQ